MHALVSSKLSGHRLNNSETQSPWDCGHHLIIHFIIVKTTPEFVYRLYNNYAWAYITGYNEIMNSRYTIMYTCIYACINYLIKHNIMHCICMPACMQPQRYIMQILFNLCLLTIPLNCICMSGFMHALHCTLYIMWIHAIKIIP